MEPWILFLDDERKVGDVFFEDMRPLPKKFVLCRSTAEAQQAIRERGLPSFMSLDHDLGGDDTTMVFLRWLVDYAEETFPNGFKVPTFYVHSANPVGAANITSFMKSWVRSRSLPTE